MESWTIIQNKVFQITNRLYSRNYLSEVWKHGKQSKKLLELLNKILGEYDAY
jgi:hypothetical protein